MSLSPPVLLFAALTFASRRWTGIRASTGISDCAGRRPVMLPDMDQAQPDWTAAAGGLVGREPELTRLLPMLDHATSAGTAVLIEGAAGIGKTALITAV